MNKCVDCQNIANKESYGDICVYRNTRRDPQNDGCKYFEPRNPKQYSFNDNDYPMEVNQTK